MIRNVVLHINGEQPLLADLFEMPSTADVSLRCTNMRLMNGKRPVFVDDMHSVFYFPYLNIRFIEIMPASLAVGDRPMPVATGVHGEVAVPTALGGPDDGADLEIDEDFLRRIREV